MSRELPQVTVTSTLIATPPPAARGGVLTLKPAAAGLSRFFSCDRPHRPVRFYAPGGEPISLAAPSLPGQTSVDRGHDWSWQTAIRGSQKRRRKNMKAIIAGIGAVLCAALAQSAGADIYTNSVGLGMDPFITFD